MGMSVVTNCFRSFSHLHGWKSQSFALPLQKPIIMNQNIRKLSRYLGRLEMKELPNLALLKGLDVEREAYLKDYITIVKDLTNNDGNNILNEAKNRLGRVLKHTVPYGRQYEGFGVIDTYKLIEKPKNLTRENIKLAHIMSWCNAITCASLVVADDIVDNEQTRKGLPCWHTLDNIGISAVNDYGLLENVVPVILKRYFSKHHCYIPTIELFYETNYNVCLGQAIDLSGMVNGRPRFEDFTRERFDFLAKYKSTVICFQFPLKLAMYLAGIYDHYIHRVTEDIAAKIGFLLMVHNDMQDAFGDFNVVGKKGTDIQNGRCTWLASEALARATPIQKQLFKEHYGKSHPESVKAIQDLYAEMELAQVFAKLESHTIKCIHENCKLISDCMPQQVFDNLLTDITLYRKGYHPN